MRAAVGAFGAAAGVTIVALVARYGYATSDTAIDGAIAAFFFGVIAVGGIAGPAAAAHLARTSPGWGAVAGLVAAVALLANLSNSLGAIAGRSDRTTAQRQAAADARADGLRELSRLAQERASLPPLTPATPRPPQRRGRP